MSGRRTLVLTGAGMSTASGIPDYRGPDGTRRVTPMQYGEFVRSADARRRYWARSFVGWANLRSARPNPAHLAVTHLQQQGFIGAVITQNVDGLHGRAGTRSVVELHGSLSRVVCLSCADVSSRAELDRRMEAQNPGFAEAAGVGSVRPDGDVSLDEVAAEAFRAPVCLRCGQDTLKPDVVFFGASVARPLVDHCFALTEAAEAVLVLGSSLAVMSGLRFVRRAATLGIPIAIITRGPTRGDELATARANAELTQALPALSRALAATT